MSTCRETSWWEPKYNESGDMIVQEKITGQVIEFITTIGENRSIILKGNLAGK